MKYINADKLIDEIIFNEEDVGIIGSKEAIDIIRSMPSADVVEVKHGEWIELPNGWDGIDEYLRFECSECHREVFSNFPYCPYCGAYMIERKETNE